MSPTPTRQSNRGWLPMVRDLLVIIGLSYLITVALLRCIALQVELLELSGEYYVGGTAAHIAVALEHLNKAATAYSAASEFEVFKVTTGFSVLAFGLTELVLLLMRRLVWRSDPEQDVERGETIVLAEK
ncbi:hypothetical protein FB45DRAFT_873385 [Roridomyces roridus]|uniref:Uncharacterized protein n=1 Tax=Roridomyces roridus TaxID=1738132 RepID=A0AAD7BBM6_9AGAR|nr:hypothetical protein FB45DRAFT_873385 [Roridomyces roridus]